MFVVDLEFGIIRNAVGNVPGIGIPNDDNRNFLGVKFGDVHKIAAYRSTKARCPAQEPKQFFKPVWGALGHVDVTVCPQQYSHSQSHCGS